MSEAMLWLGCLGLAISLVAITLRHFLPDELAFGLICRADRPPAPAFRAGMILLAFGSVLLLTSVGIETLDAREGRLAPRSDHYAFLMGAFLAVTGWVATNTINTVNQRKQHTLKILFEMRHSQIYQDHIHTLQVLTRTYKAYDRPLTCKEIETRPDGAGGFAPCPEQINAVDFILNHFEFIALGVRNGDLDPHFVRKSLAGQILGTYPRFEAWIEAYARAEPAKGRRYATLRTYENFLWLIGWYAELFPDRGFQTAIRPRSAYLRDIKGVLWDR